MDGWMATLCDSEYIKACKERGVKPLPDGEYDRDGDEENIEKQDPKCENHQYPDKKLVEEAVARSLKKHKDDLKQLADYDMNRKRDEE